MIVNITERSSGKMSKYNSSTKTGSIAVIILFLVLVVALILGGLFYLNKNKPTTNQSTGTQTENPVGSAETGNALSSAPPSYPTASSNVDEQLKSLDDEAKNIDQSLNDKPIDVLAE